MPRLHLRHSAAAGHWPRHPPPCGVELVLLLLVSP